VLDGDVYDDFLLVPIALNTAYLSALVVGEFLLVNVHSIDENLEHLVVPRIDLEELDSEAKLVVGW
jgi:hypothetical protein